MLRWLILGVAKFFFAGGLEYLQTKATLLFSGFTGRGIGKNLKRVEECGLTRENDTI